MNKTDRSFERFVTEKTDEFYSHIKIPSYKNISIYKILDECIGITKERLKTKRVFINENLMSLKDLCIEADPL